MTRAENGANHDLRDIQMQMNATTDESKDAGIRTLVMLDEQGEQLDRIEDGMTQINQDMRHAEENLADMEKCCGLCILPWKRTKKVGKGDKFASSKKNEDGKLGSNGPRLVVANGNMGPQGGYITRITNDACEDEMEKNMGDVAGMVGNLRNMAVDMNSELESQIQQVIRITDKAELTKDRIDKANVRAVTLITTK